MIDFIQLLFLCCNNYFNLLHINIKYQMILINLIRLFFQISSNFEQQISRKIFIQSFLIEKNSSNIFIIYILDLYLLINKYNVI